MIKQGIVSHGYQLNGEVDLWRDWKAKGLDKAFSRGELAVEPNPRNGTYGNLASSPAWSLQANAEWALTFGLGGASFPSGGGCSTIGCGGGGGGGMDKVR